MVRDELLARAFAFGAATGASTATSSAGRLGAAGNDGGASAPEIHGVLLGALALAFDLALGCLGGVSIL